MAMETSQILVLQSCMSVWRVPGISKYVWPNVGHGLRLLQSSDRLNVAVGMSGLSVRAENHARVCKETVMHQMAMRRVRGSQTISRGQNTASRNVFRPSIRDTFNSPFPVSYYQSSPPTYKHRGGRARVIHGLTLSLGRKMDFCLYYYWNGHVLGPWATGGLCNLRGATTSGTAEMLVTIYWRNLVELRRGMSTEAWLRRHKEEGDWQFSPEWWGTQGGSWGRNAGETVFQSLSTTGNGVISVTAHPASTPIPEDWAVVEKELQERDASRGHGQFKVLGYEWRVLRFNSVTRQSVAKVMAVINDQQPKEVFLVQQPNCIAFEYVKSMLSVGLSTISLAGYNLDQVTHTARNMRILCVGLGGGSLPLFLAHNLPGATLDVVEIDGSVIEAAVGTMGFPPCKIHRSQSNVSSRSLETGNHRHSNNVPGGHFDAGHKYAINQEVLWGSILNRMTVYEADGEHFMEDLMRKKSDKGRFSCQYYDLVFVDAFDGEDVVPTKLWTRDGTFLQNLNELLHPKHGTVVVNLHTDSPPPSILEKVTGQYGPGFDPSLTQGRKIQEACCTYRDVLLPPGIGTGTTAGLAFTVAVPSQGNISLVVSRGLSVQSHLDSQSQNQPPALEKQMFVEKLQAESKYVQKVLNTRLDFSKRVSRGLQVVQENVRPSKVL